MTARVAEIGGAHELDRRGATPLWVQLLRDLRRRLGAGEFSDAFPGELALVAEYRVSRHTVREALRRLREEGLVVAERGRPPRLASPTEIAQPLGTPYSLFQSVESTGRVQRNVVRTLDVRADGVVAARLGLEESTPLVHLERLRFSDEEPLAIDRVWLPERLAAPLLDVDRLDRWIGDRLPGHGHPLIAERIGATTGIANALFRVSRAGRAWVLRRPPAVKNDPSASNTLREWRILQALEGTAVPHPEPVLFCADIGVLGSEFMLMAVVDGFTPGFDLPEPFLGDVTLRRDLGMAYVDGLVHLAAVDWRAKGLADLGKPAGFLARQVPRWLAQLDRYRTRDLPELDFLTEWLSSNMPTMGPAAIIHGDYSPFNVMVTPTPPARLAAIVDWDTGTIGDPLLDIGHLLARWTEPGEAPIITEQAGGAAGYPTRAEMAARYAELSGRDLTALPYYQALALFKLAIILEGSHARQVKAGTDAERTDMGPRVLRILSGAAEFARGQRR